jgi:hypothetical protein
VAWTGSIYKTVPIPGIEWIWTTTSLNGKLFTYELPFRSSPKDTLSWCWY